MLNQLIPVKNNLNKILELPTSNRNKLMNQYTLTILSFKHYIRIMKY